MSAKLELLPTVTYSTDKSSDFSTIDLTTKLLFLPPAKSQHSKFLEFAY